jgi:GNAT superfamily N-acetyltransferase
MIFSDLTLTRRLERAEGHACLQIAEARRRLFPSCGTAWMELDGAFAVFDGVDSPCTQSFGLGIFEQLNPATLDAMEAFFLGFGAPVVHEVSPFAGTAAHDLLCARNYRPCEISSVLYRPVERPSEMDPGQIRVRVIGPDESALWAETSARGWADQHPELMENLLQLSSVCAARADSPCFLAEYDGTPGAAGVLCMHQGVALFGGSATVPLLRRRGLQAALLHQRMQHAFDHGCDLAMMVASPGSNSQRNAERIGFRIAYTRTKWKLFQR